jgi:type I restriction enzyme, S subunit
MTGPRHWDSVPLGGIGRLFKGNGGTKEDEVPAGVPCIRYGDLYSRYETFITTARSFVTAEAARAYTLIRFGDVLFAGSGETIEEIGKSAVNLLDGEACCGGDVLVCRPVRVVNPRFLGYVLDAPGSVEQKARMGRGVTVMHIYADELRKLRIALPPLDEQATIVRFLDHADRRIRRAIRSKQTLIGLLNEQKQAAIHRAVTRGLDPDARLRPSGVNWLGDVPEGWQVRKLGSLFRIQGSGTTPPHETDYGGNVPWVMTGELNDGEIGVTRRTVTEAALESLSALRLFPRGSLVVAMYGATIGKTAVLGMAAATNQACCVLADPLENANVRYVQACVQLARFDLKQRAYGGGQPNINAEVVRSLRVPVPSRHEQDEIIRKIRTETAALSESLGVAQDQVELLREYRARLIEDVVTGQFDVRETAARLPDEPDEPEQVDERELEEVDDPDIEASEVVEA